MPKRKKPERSPQMAEPLPPASPPPAESGQPRHRRIAARLEAVVADLPADRARAALAALAPADDTARRAVRVALVALLRRAADAAPAPDPEPAPLALPVAEAAPPPAAPKAGVLNTLALDQAARMLFAASSTEDEGPAAPAPDPGFTPTPLPKAQALPKADLSALDGLAEDAGDPPPPPPMAEGKPKRRKTKATDPAAVAALLADAAEPAPPPPLAIDVSATLAALQAAEAPAPAAKKPPLDLSAQFAAMEGGPDGD